MISFPDLYDWVMGGAEHGPLATWRRDTIGPAQGYVLEIAAGTGLNFAHYHTGISVVATEPDHRMLERARSRARLASASIVLVAADAQLLPFPDGTFDTAVVGLGLCTIPSPLKALAELRRVLRRGGVAHLLEHVRMDRPIVGRLQDLVSPAWRRVAGGCRLNQRTLELVEQQGFRIDEIRVHAGGLVVGVRASS